MQVMKGFVRGYAKNVREFQDALQEAHSDTWYGAGTMLFWTVLLYNANVVSKRCCGHGVSTVFHAAVCVCVCW